MIRTLILCIGLVSACLDPTPVSAQTSSGPVDLARPWFFRWEAEKTGIKDIDRDSAKWNDFQKIDEILNNRETQARNLWLRIRLPEGQWPDAGLYLKSVQISFDVYLTGHRIYSFPDPSSSEEGQFAGTQDHFIPLPPEFQSRNLFIKILNPHSKRSSLANNIPLGSRTELLLHVMRENLDQFILGFFFIFIGTFGFIVFIKDSKQKTFFSFGLFLFCSGIYAVFMTPTWRLLFKEFGPWQYFAELVSLYFVPIGILLFVEQNLKSGLMIWVRRLWQIHLLYAFGATGFVLLNVISLYSTHTPFRVILLVDVVVVLTAVIRETVKGNTRARMFGLGIAGLALCALHDVLAALSIIPKIHTLFPWGVLIFTIFIGYILERQLAETYMKREKERAKLREAQLRAQAAGAEIENAKRLAVINSELEQTISQLKSTQAQLIQSDKMASLGQLTAGIAHEINNPVNFISSGIKSLNRDFGVLNELIIKIQTLDSTDGINGKLEEIRSFLKEQLQWNDLGREISDLIKGIEDGAVRTTEIVRGLRTFSRIDEKDTRPFNIHEGIDTTLTLLRNQTKERIEIVKEYGNIPTIEAFPGLLNQVFMNMVSNAIQAIPERGVVTIHTESKDDHVMIRFSDNGIGMNADTIKRIYDPFFTTKEVGRGTGLGLYISYNIIQKHSGTITVASEPGRGTDFTITLPIAATRIQR
jgi:signal transduction histidine kinase